MSTIPRLLRKLFAKPHLHPNTDAFLDLFVHPSKLEKVATGLQFTEGPVWIAPQNHLLFSDIPASKIYQLDWDRNHLTIFRTPSSNSNGLTCDRQGRLIACEHGRRRVTRTETDGSITTLCEQFKAKKLNSPNDVIVRSDGSIYFTDPPYGIAPEQQEQPIQGVYHLSPDRILTCVIDDFILPNGLALSPDEMTLYVADSSERCHIRAFDVQPDGRLSGDREFYNMKLPQSIGCPDGMKVDQGGNLYATGPNGVWVFTPAGVHLGTIVLPEQPTNCAWGDHGGQSLYITAQTSVYKILVTIPGVLCPSP
jgi:gluconolactonase